MLMDGINSPPPKKISVIAGLSVTGRLQIKKKKALVDSLLNFEGT